jgi:hypothetical protein
MGFEQSDKGTRTPAGLSVDQVVIKVPDDPVSHVLHALCPFTYHAEGLSAFGHLLDGEMIDIIAGCICERTVHLFFPF